MSLFSSRILGSLLHLIHAITHTHASTCTTSFTCVKIALPLLFMTLTVWNIGMKEVKHQI